MENWEKELRKKKHYDSLIINRPEVMKNLRRRMEISVTTIGWVVWIFLCRPLFILLLWLIGFRFFFEHMIDLGGLMGLNELKYIYITIFIAIVLLVRGWNMYNKIRYGKKTRRRKATGVTDKNIEDYFKLPPESAKELQNLPELDIEFLEDHQIHVKDTENPSRTYDGFFRST